MHLANQLYTTNKVERSVLKVVVLVLIISSRLVARHLKGNWPMYSNDFRISIRICMYTYTKFLLLRHWSSYKYKSVCTAMYSLVMSLVHFLMTSL